MSRLAYIALWNEADDEGRLRANEVYLRSRLFPYAADLNLAEVLTPLVEAGKLKLYEVDGQAFGYLPRFNSHQVINRPTPSKLPPPTDSVSTHGALTEHSRGKGKEGKGTGKGKEQEQGKRTSAPCAKPGIAEVDAYAKEIGLPTTETPRFLDYYTGNGWRVGRNPMKDWRAALRNWKRNFEERIHPGQRNQRPATETDHAKGF
jgi:hypothetical protein